MFNPVSMLIGLSGGLFWGGIISTVYQILSKKTSPELGTAGFLLCLIYFVASLTILVGLAVFKYLFFT